MKFHKSTILLMSSSLLLIVSCGSDGSSLSQDVVDAVEASDPGPTSDPGPLDSAGSTDDTGPPPATCESLLKLETTFDLFYAQPDGQIHGAAAFDGQGIWLTWNQPTGDGSGGFDVWAARLRCDGTFDVAPFPVQTGDLGNDVDPDIAVNGGNVYVAWQTDTGGDPNLLIHYRTFRVDGTPLMEKEHRLEPVLDGTPVTGAMWLTRVAGLPDGRFAITGSWASDAAQRFQVFLQRFNAAGQPEGDAIEAFFESEVGQTFPALASRSDGSLHLAYTREEGGVNHVVHTGLAPGQFIVDPSPPALAGQQPGASAALAAGEETGGPVFLAFHTDVDAPDVLVRNGAINDPDAPAATFGATGKLDHTPSVAVGKEGGAVMWFRVRSGIRNDVLIQRFTVGAQAVVPVGSERILNPEDMTADHAAPPIYTPAITHVRDHVYFTAWSEGKSPLFRLKGRFVDLQ